MTQVPLALTLRSPHHWPIALLAIGLAAAACWLYLARGGNASSPRRWWLALLRTTVIALVGLAALQPTVSLSDPLAGRPRLVVLVDDSLSMATIDDWSSVAQRVRIADGIGLLPPGLRTDPTAPLRAALLDLRAQVEVIDEAQEEIDYARLIGRDTAAQEARVRSLVEQLSQELVRLTEQAKRDPRLRRAQERLRAMQPVDPDRPDQVTRGLQQVGQALRAIADDADADLASRDPRASQAAAQVAASSRLELARLAIEQPERGIRARLSPRYEVVVRTLSGADWGRSSPAAGPTDLHAALARVRADAPASFAGVLVLSDGRQTEPTPATPSSTPTWAVQVGSASPRRDPALTQLSLAASSRPGQPLLIRGVARLVSARDETATLRASHDEQSASRSVRVPANARQATIELSLPAPTAPPGSYRVVVELETTGDDATSDNNRSVVVVEQHPAVDVMLVGSLSRRDVQCLDAWLERPAYRARRLVRGAAGGSPLVVDEPSLRDTHTLVLADVAPSDLTPDSWQRIERATREQGLTVVVFCADPTLLRSLGRAEASRWLLPVEPPEAIGWRSWSGDAPRLRVIADRQHGDRAAVDVEFEESRRRWLASPRFFRFVSLPTLPTAGQAWLREIDSLAPLVASWSHGSGEVRWLGLSETWRWRRADQSEDVQSALFRALVEPPRTDGDHEAALRRARQLESERLRELADLAADTTSLENLARCGPGALTPLTELSSLLDRLLAEPPPPPSRRDVPLWSTWSWLGLCVGALTLEWSLRKQGGLV